MRTIIILTATALALSGCAYQACDSSPDPSACKANIVAASQRSLANTQKTMAESQAASRAAQPKQTYCSTSGNNTSCTTY